MLSDVRPRVAICDDSRSFALGLRRFLQAERRLDVVALAHSADELMAALGRARPDLITMDLELPGIDGVEAIRRIMASRPVPIIVISTHVAGADDGRVDAAFAAGAIDAVAKSELRLDLRLSPRAVALRRRLVRLARGPSDPAAAQRPPVAARATHPDAPPRRARPVVTVIGIAASTGGPAALREVLGALPEHFGLPVLVVQHIAEGFAAGLASWLDGVVAPPVRLARDGEPAGRGIVIAPAGTDLVLTPAGTLRLGRPGAHRPSADVLLASLADVAKDGAVAVVLTGMGRDGAAGVAAVRAAHGMAFAERPEHARLSSMPDAAARAGASMLERAEIGRTLASLAPRARP